MVPGRPPELRFRRGVDRHQGARPARHAPLLPHSNDPHEVTRDQQGEKAQTAQASPRARHPDRPVREGRRGDLDRAQRAAGRHLCALCEDQEFPLARQRAAFPQLSSPARRAGRADREKSVDILAERVRKVGGTTIRSIGHIAKLQRAARQRRGLRHADRHAVRADGRQQGHGREHAQGPQARRRARGRGDREPARGVHRRGREAQLVPVRGQPRRRTAAVTDVSTGRRIAAGRSRRQAVW